MIKEKTPVGEIMRQAYRHRVLVPAFNIACIPMIKSIVESLGTQDIAYLQNFGIDKIRLN